MSYPYRVTVSRSVERQVQASDEERQRLRLDPILEPRETRELVSEALQRRGFEQDADGTLRRSLEGGEEQSFDLDELELTTRLTSTDTMSREKTLEVVGDAWSKEAKAEAIEAHTRAAEAKLEAELDIAEEELEDGRRELARELTSKLAAGEGARRRELLELLAEVQAEALKKKAARIGTVLSIDERRSADGQDFELEIRIRE